LFKLQVKTYLIERRIDFKVVMNKNNRWEPENVYLPLPLKFSNIQSLWLDKPKAAVRPRFDQIPGTLIDFYSIQEGIALCSDAGGLVLATPDTNLVHLGDLEYKNVKTFNPAQGSEFFDDQLFVWLMSNYWETNFNAGLGGFYEFDFYLKWSDKFKDYKKAFNECRLLNAGIKTFRVGD